VLDEAAGVCVAFDAVSGEEADVGSVQFAELVPIVAAHRNDPSPL
jgi:hypothetical protein